ncbi:MAG: preprotein translocase subunit YajC [Eubacteriaceae bacterium]
MIATTTTTASPLNSFFPFLLIIMFVLIYMVSMRPQRKQYKNLQAKREMMKKGDKVVTAGGIHGKVFSVKDNYVIIEVMPDNVKMKINKSSISEVELREVPTKKNDEADDVIDDDAEQEVSKKAKSAKDYSKKNKDKNQDVIYSNEETVVYSKDTENSDK